MLLICTQGARLDNELSDLRRFIYEFKWRDIRQPVYNLKLLSTEVHMMPEITTVCKVKCKDQH